MNFLYEPPGQEVSSITKALYYRYPQDYFMLELFINGTGANPQTVKSLERIFLPVQAIDGSRKGRRCKQAYTAAVQAPLTASSLPKRCSG
jgi:hypothetical protein